MLKAIFILLSSIFILSSSQIYNNESKKDLDSNCIVILKEDSKYDKKEIQKYFYNSLISSIGFSYRKIDTFDSLSNIVSIKVNHDDIQTINNLSIVEQAYQEKEYTLNDYSINDPNYSYLFNSSIPENISSREMNKGESGDGDNTIVAILDTSLYLEHESFSSLDDSCNPRYSKSDIDSIIALNKNDFHASNYKYYNSKVPFSYDYCGDRKNANPDDDVKSTLEHGSHVASIVSSNGRYKGIAPKSQIAFFKIFTNYGTGCTTSIYLKALEDAYLLDVDAINMSFGNTLDYSESQEDLAVQSLISKMNEKGIQTFISSGNDGKEFFKSSSYQFSNLDNYESSAGSFLSDASNGNSVGSFSSKESLNNVYATDGTYSYEINDRIISRVSLDSSYTINVIKFDKEQRFNQFIGNGFFEIIEIPNYGDKEDYKGLDLKGKIALVKRGNIYFYKKIHYALESGCIGLIIYSSKDDSSQLPYFSYLLQDEEDKNELPYFIEDGIYYYDYKKIDIPVAVMNYSDASNLKKNSLNKKISFFQTQISNFSSQGGDPYLNLSPDFIAPGSDIYGAKIYGEINDGTYASSKDYLSNAYTFKSGTSMSSPNSLGAFLSLLGNYEIKDEEERINYRKLSINKLRSGLKILSNDEGIYYSPRLQGGGLIDIQNALNNNSYLTYNNKNKIELKNNDSIKEGIIDFKVIFNSLNLSESNYKITLKVLAPKITSINFDNEEKEVTSLDDTLLEEIDFSSLGNNLKDKDEIYIKYTLNETSKKYLSKFENGTYLEGYLEVKNEDESLSIPFLGYYGNNYDLIKPYEDFDFEKDPSKIYESDLMEETISTYLNKDRSDIVLDSSMLYGQDTLDGQFGSYYTYYLRNCNNFFVPFKEGTPYNLYSRPEYIYNNDENTYDIYLDNIKSKLGLTIQLFMKRSIKDSRILLDDKIQEVNSSQDLFGRFIDNVNTSSSHQLFRSYILNQNSNKENFGYTHRALGYVIFGDSTKYQDIEDGKHTLTFEFTTFNNNVLTYKYNLYINESYSPKPLIYDVSIKNNILKVYLKRNNEDEISVELNDNKIIDKLEIKDNYYYFEYDLNSLNEDLYFKFVNSYLNSTSLKIFSSLDNDIYYIYGDKVNKNTSISKDAEEYIEGEYKYLKTTYRLNNLNEEESLNNILSVGIINSNDEDIFYLDSISESNIINVEKLENYYRFDVSSNTIIKLSNKEKIKKDNDDDSKDSSDFNFLNKIIIGLVIFFSILIITLITIFLILKSKLSKKK